MTEPLRNRVRRAAALVLTAVLLWQAGAGVIYAVDSLRTRSAVGYGDRLTASTKQRIAALLGASTVIYERILECVPLGHTILTLLPAAENATMADRGRGETINRLRHLVNTDRFMSLGYPNSVLLAEGNTKPDVDTWLLLLGRDGAPVGRPGWALEAEDPLFQLWRFQKD